MNSQYKRKSDEESPITGSPLDENTQSTHPMSHPEMKPSRSKRAGRPRLEIGRAHV